jgi:hypothetical protein
VQGTGMPVPYDYEVHNIRKWVSPKVTVTFGDTHFLQKIVDKYLCYAILYYVDGDYREARRACEDNV